MTMTMTGVIIEKRRQEFRSGDSVPAEDGDLLGDELNSDPMTGGHWGIPVFSCLESGFPTTGGGHSGGNKIDRSVNVGSRSPESTRVCIKRPVSR